MSASPCICESLWWFRRPLDLHSTVSPGDGETLRWQVPDSRRQRVRLSASPGNGESLLQRFPVAGTGGDSLHRRVAFVGESESLRRRVPASASPCVSESRRRRVPAAAASPCGDESEESLLQRVPASNGWRVPSSASPPGGGKSRRRRQVPAAANPCVGESLRLPVQATASPFFS